RQLNRSTPTRLSGSSVNRSPWRPVQRAAEDGLGRLVRDLAIKAVVFAVLAGAVLGALGAWGRWGAVLVGGAGAGLGVTTLLAVTWQEFSVDALRKPTYDGMIERAPEVIKAVEKGVVSYQGVQDRLDALSARIK